MSPCKCFVTQRPISVRLMSDEFVTGRILRGGQSVPWCTIWRHNSSRPLHHQTFNFSVLLSHETGGKLLFYVNIRVFPIHLIDPELTQLKRKIWSFQRSRQMLSMFINPLRFPPNLCPLLFTILFNYPCPYALS